jgi:taurine dioxygenase
VEIRRCSSEAVIGAEVFGVSAKDDQPPEVIAAIAEALFTHHVLVLRDQFLSADEQLRFAARLGEVVAPEPSKGLTTHEEVHPEIQWLGYLRPDGSPPPDPRPSQADTWHTDYSYLPRPPELAFLFGVDIPADGPDTLYLDMQRAYESLPASRRELFDDLRAIHTQKGALDPRTYRLPPYVVDGEAPDERISPERRAVHPLVQTHPVTGRRSLYLAQCYTTGFEGVNADEGAAIIAEIYRHAERPELSYRHVWRRGDCVLNDNTMTNHRRSKPLSGPRVLSRIMVALDRTETRA